jgi:hypothetical protein
MRARSCGRPRSDCGELRRGRGNDPKYLEREDVGMSGNRSRRKGKSGELEVEKRVKAHGFDCDRTLDGRRQEHGDMIGFEGFAVEVKRRERGSVAAWSREIESKLPAHLTPAVAYRANGEPWRVSLLLDDFLDLLKEARS